MSNSNKPEIWFIHGANATPTSFVKIQDALEQDGRFNDFISMNVVYDCQDSLAFTIETIADALPDDRPIYLIGHSLGGVIAVGVSQRVKHFELKKNVQTVITMASPIGGCEGADYLKWIFPHYHLFKNISTKNPHIISMKATGAVVPTLNLITTSGNNPVYPEANDGVVTVNSQRALPNSKKIEIASNHFEVLMIQTSIDYIKQAIISPSDIFGPQFKVQKTTPN